ncbi:MAG TPA: hypothetical protein VHA57_10605 [Actinomycetota bacterium]|nr:hypothetical protein [Actinomycetota bacterium]
MRGVERAAPQAGHYQITSATVFDQLSDPPTTAIPIPQQGA